MAEHLKDPLLGFSFYISINKIMEAGFTSCSGLSVKREVSTHQEGGVNDQVHTLPGRASYGNITLKRGIAFSHELWEWFDAMFNFGLGGEYSQKAYRDIEIHQCIPYTATTVRTYQLLQAFPVSWTGPNLDMNSNEVAVESLEIAFAKFRVNPESNRN